jgi:hypothetical protein
MPSFASVGEFVICLSPLASAYVTCCEFGHVAWLRVAFHNPAMPWIETIPPDAAGPELRTIYAQIYALYPPSYRDAVPTLINPDGSEDSIIAAHSLIPQAMLHIGSALGVLYQPDLPLTRRQQEMIAAVVSAQNRCFY